jgi:hypothetical protein
MESAEPILNGAFTDPFTDVDEWREAPAPHRYVHGGFTGTETRFSIYFPPAARYRGRFFQHITPVPGSEHLAQTATGQEDKIGFAFSSGGYFLETNGGGASGAPGSAVDPTIAGYRANAASAAYSRVIARRVYGEHRPYGYAYGGSGGAYRTIGGAENTVGVWDGVVPYVIGSPMAIPNVFCVRMHAQRVLRDKLDQIVDAVEPGGSGDPFAGLDPEERAALEEVTRMGFPPRSWFGHRTMGMHAFGRLYPGIVMADPGYFEEFWTTPGYLGADPAASVHRDRVRLSCEVTGTVTRGDGEDLGPYCEQSATTPRSGVDEAFKGSPAGQQTIVAIRLASAPGMDVQGADLIVRSGAAAGARMSLKGTWKDLAVIDFPDLGRPLGNLSPGDTVEIDNSNFLAAQTYHRHQVPSRDYAVWDQFRDADGTPTYPQRSLLLGPLFSAAAAGHTPTGEFAGKMIVVECLLDREAFPWQADWYRSRVAEHLGDGIDDRFRLWYADNALHGDREAQEDPTRTVSYVGVLHKALRDLSEWVEQGTPPAPSTSYAVHDGQVTVPASAASRRGVQPVVSLTANGGPRADVPQGAQVTLTAVAEAPPGGGKIVRIQWDLDGDGTFETDDTIEPATRVTVTQHCAYDSSGTRFVTVRVSAQPDGDPSTPFARMDNLARARIVTAHSIDYASLRSTRSRLGRRVPGQARWTGRDSRPCMRLTGCQRSSSGGTASHSPGKRASRAPRATSASRRAREAPRQ